MNEQITQDALEYGLYVRGGDWRLGLLVARSVEKDTGNPNKPTRSNRNTSKVSAREFAKTAGTSPARVLRHLEMWDKAAEAGLVPAAATLSPGDEAKLPDPEKHPTSDYYTSVSGGFNGGKERVPTVDAVIDSTDRLSAADRAKLATALVAQEPVREAILMAGPLAIEQHLELAAEVFQAAEAESDRIGKRGNRSRAARSAADELATANRHAQRALAEVIQWNVRAEHDRLLVLHSSIRTLKRTVEQIEDLVGDPHEVE